SNSLPVFVQIVAFCPLLHSNSLTIRSRFTFAGVFLTLGAILLPLMLIGCQDGKSSSKPEGVSSNDTIVDNPRGNGLKGKKKPGGGD
ncbi:MAG: hypothetical protein ABUL72_06875, partial [Armatimonadota bacterium]